VTCVTFSPDGKTLASGGQDKTIRLWDVETGKIRKTIVTHSSHPTDHDRLAIDRSHKSMLEAIERETSQLKGDAGESDIGDMAIKLAFNWMLEGERQTLEAHAKARRTAGYCGYVASLAYSPDGKTLATAIYATFGPKGGRR